MSTLRAERNTCPHCGRNNQATDVMEERMRGAREEDWFRFDCDHCKREMAVFPLAGCGKMANEVKTGTSQDFADE